ncbi:MAG TPA: hypothetical protein VGC76_15160 [Pyrinomonadaceae bacterium]|jgi:hypothetical protein
MFQPDKIKNKIFLGGAFLIFIALGAACEKAPSMMENRATPLPTSETAEKLTSLQREIRDMETANFTTIYVFKRKDGGVFDKEDKKYLSANKPADANRFVLTDDEKAFVAGSNYPFSTENLDNLQKRFVVEDYSKPLVQVNVSVNGNANVKANVNTNAKANKSPAKKQ